ncbi:MAG: hypothetical protein RLZZ126_519 [Pseudomonadota bacterium]
MARSSWLAAQDQFTSQAEKALSLIEIRLPASEALLRTLAEAARSGGPAAVNRLEAKLPQTHPQLVSLVKRDTDASWGDESLRVAEAASEAGRGAVLTHWGASGRYTLVLGAEPLSLAATFDLRASIPWADWPMARDQHPMRLSVELDRQALVLQEGWRVNLVPGHMDFSISRPIAAPWTPAFRFEARQSYDLEDLPWSKILNLALGAALLLLALRAFLRLRHDQERAAELLQIGNTGRLNSLAELASVLAHELRAPLGTALDAIRDSQGKLAGPVIRPVDALASNMLAEEEISHAVNVVERLHQVTQRPDVVLELQPINLNRALAHALDVLQPELDRLHVTPHLSGKEVDVLAQPQAVQQIAYHLVMNALQALESTPPPGRQLMLRIEADGQVGRLSVQDNGPGIPYEALARVREPFFTTRADGLGLGLSVCDRLATDMGGTITVYNRNEGGAEFNLNLKLADPR